MESILHIKNMVCNRCIKVVKDELEKMNYHLTHIELGKVIIEEQLDRSALINIKAMLEENGFELIDDKRSKLVDGIKTLIIEKIHHSENEGGVQNFSDIISQHLNYDYPYLSKLFSQVEGVTIEKYIINQKIEKAKELLVYNELSLSEISYRLGYSSVQHLSSQFKKVTGLTPSYFKNMKEHKRKPLDKV